MQFPFKKEYEYFLLLCKTLNISKASEILDLQQPSLSKALKKLEEEHKIKLFVRQSTGLKLTENGEQLQASILKSLKTFEDHQNDQFNETINGHFTISLHPVISLITAPLFMTKLLKEFPQLNIKLDFCSSRSATRKVSELFADFAIVAEPIATPNLVILKLFNDTVSIWSGEKDAKKRDQLLYYHPEMIGIHQLLKDFKDYKHVPLSDYEVLAECLLKSSAVGILPTINGKRFPGLFEVERLKKEVPICLIYNSERPKTKSFVKILETIKKTFKY
jgi:LysR family transcriptional regulator, cell division regulator